MHIMRLIANCVILLQEDNEQHPITFLGVTAGPTLLKTGLTLTISIASIALRNVLLSLFQTITGGAF